MTIGSTGPSEMSLARALARASLAVDLGAFDVDVIASLNGDMASAAAEARYPIVMIGPRTSAIDRANLVRTFHERSDAMAPLLWIAPVNGHRDMGMAASPREYLLDALQIEALAPRLQALLKLKRGDLGAVLRVGNVTLDSAAREVVIARKATFFPPAEVVVLAMLMQREGRIVPKKLIETRLYGATGQKAANAAEVCIHRLRKRLATTAANVRIRTIHRAGYFISE